jgi:DNA-binding PadR family transcriptional regulator
LNSRYTSKNKETNDMDAAQTASWGGPRGRHHHHHHGPRGWEGLLAMAQGRHGGGAWGFDPRFFKEFAFGPGGGRGGPFGPFGPRGPKARRGDVRAALLLLLAEEPQNGYQLIQEIERRTEGFWKPSPGSVYPALQQLEDEGLVRAQEIDGRRAYTLTDEGREYVDSAREELGDPFAAATGGIDEGVMDLRQLMMQVFTAVMQVSGSGHTEKAREILAETRRKLYKVLAEDDEPSTEV